MVYAVVDMEAYLTTTGETADHSVHSNESEFYYSVNFKVREAIVSFPWVLHGLVSSYVCPPSMYPERLRTAVELTESIREQDLLPRVKEGAFFGDLIAEEYGNGDMEDWKVKSKVLKRNDCTARSADLIMAGRLPFSRGILEVLDKENILACDIKKKVSHYLADGLLVPIGFHFDHNYRVSPMGLPHINREVVDQRSLDMFNDGFGGGSKLEALLEVPCARAALLKYVDQPGPLFRTSRHMWKVGMSKGLVDWRDAAIEDLLAKGVCSEEAFTWILPNIHREPAPMRDVDMLLLKRLMDEPRFYTDHAWTLAVETFTLEGRAPDLKDHEALELFLNRPLLRVPTPCLVIGLAWLSSVEPDHLAARLLQLVVEVSGREQVQQLALEAWRYSAFQKRGSACVPRLVDGSLYLETTFEISAWDPEVFLKLASANRNAETLFRGAFHDKDEHGHSKFTEALLQSINHRDTYRFLLDLVTTNPIRIKDRQTFLPRLKDSKDLFQPRDDSADSSDIDKYKYDIRFLSHSGHYDMPLRPFHVVSALMALNQSFLGTVNALYGFPRHMMRFSRMDFMRPQSEKQSIPVF
ncbi:hypothetical protein HKX48_004854 [Thoreauomyces humboldtii]|nr:hypothetical protein HKX48_004854 [Thoreauomyces humboldtii]